MNELNLYYNETINTLEYRGHLKHGLLMQISLGVVIQMRTSFISKYN